MKTTRFWGLASVQRKLYDPHSTLAQKGANGIKGDLLQPAIRVVHYRRLNGRFVKFAWLPPAKALDDSLINKQYLSLLLNFPERFS